MASEEIKDKVKQLIGTLSREEQLLLKGVIRAEQEKLHMKNPFGINDDIERIVREVFK